MNTLFLSITSLSSSRATGRQPFLIVNLLRCAEPQHILSPLGNGLDIQQVLNTNVLGNGVAAPGAAAQCEGRSKLEVVEVADATLRKKEC